VVQGESGIPGFLKGWGSLLVATVALVQPWALALWRKFFRPGSVDIYETGLLELGYNVWGPCVGLRGTLRAVHRDQFIRNIELTVVKEKDGSTHVLDWLLFRAEKITGLGTEDTSAEIATGFMLMMTQPHRYSILFADTATQNELKPHVAALVEAWSAHKSTPGVIASLVANRDIYGPFSTTKVHTDTFTVLDRQMYWEPGRYSFEMRVHTTRPERTFTRTWTFEISKAESERLRLNAVVICRLACDQGGTYIFVNPKYEAKALPPEQKRLKP